MDTDAQAEAAIQGLNDHEHDGRRLVVSEAKPRVVLTTRLPVAALVVVVIGNNGHRHWSLIIAVGIEGISRFL